MKHLVKLSLLFLLILATPHFVSAQDLTIPGLEEATARPPGTVFIFSDYANSLDKAYLAELEKLCRSKRVKVILWNPVGGKWLNKNDYKKFTDAVGGEMKDQVLK